MSIEQLKEDIKIWILDWVSVYNEQLGTVPCPFAKQALLTNKIDYATAQDLDGVKGLLQLFAMGGINNDVLIIGVDKNNVTAQNLSLLVKDVNINILMPAGFVALEDHPDDKEIINGVKMNQGTWALVLVQELDKINQASRMLLKQDYYKNWSQNEYDDVVSWRFLKE
jgi:hypothetical protein